MTVCISLQFYTMSRKEWIHLMVVINFLKLLCIAVVLYVTES